jgi:hypothetical protein
MANEWQVIEDKNNGVKRFVKIYDKINDKFYFGYFPTNATDASVKTRFKKQVKEFRAERELRKPTLDLTNFETGL